MWADIRNHNGTAIILSQASWSLTVWKSFPSLSLSRFCCGSGCSSPDGQPGLWPGFNEPLAGAADFSGGGPGLGHVAAEPRCQCLLSSDDFSGQRGMKRPSSLCKKLANAWQKLEFLDLLGPLCCPETDVDVDGLCFCKLMRKASVCAGVGRVLSKMESRVMCRCTRLVSGKVLADFTCRVIWNLLSSESTLLVAWALEAEILPLGTARVNEECVNQLDLSKS